MDIGKMYKRSETRETEVHSQQKQLSKLMKDEQEKDDTRTEQ